MRFLFCIRNSYIDIRQASFFIISKMDYDKSGSESISWAYRYVETGFKPVSIIFKYIKTLFNFILDSNENRHHSRPGKFMYMLHPRQRGTASSPGESNFCSSLASATDAKNPVPLMAEHRISISFRFSGIFAWSSG